VNLEGIFFEPHYHGSAPAFRRRGVPGATACAGPAVVSMYLRTIVHPGQGVDGYAADRHEQVLRKLVRRHGARGQDPQDPRRL